MQYQGGKEQLAKYLVPEINKRIGDRVYVEPFIGGASIISRVECLDRTGSDEDLAVVSMWQAVTDGWEPPSALSADEYRAARDLPDTDPLKAFAMFGCSFGGSFNAGHVHARNTAVRSRDYVVNAADSVRKKGLGLRGGLLTQRPCKILHRSVFDIAPASVADALVYCDPPYAGTKPYRVGEFDHAAFWEWCRDASSAGAVVLVSELCAPRDFECVWHREAKRGPSGRKRARTERLFLAPR